MSSKFSKWILSAFIVLSLIQTFALMKSHFTHVDDLGVAVTLLKENQSSDQICALRFEAAKHRWYASVAPFKDIICTKAVPTLERLRIVPNSWTYAPLQFWITQGLLSPTKSYAYEEVKFLGRLPSFLFFIAGLICFYQLLIKKIKDFNAVPIISIALTSIAAFSLEQRIMASQMHSYAIGLLSFSICLWALFEITELPTTNYRRILCSSAILAIGVSMQYQATLLVAAGLMSLGILLAYKLIKNKIEIESIIKYCTFTLATIFFTYLLVGDISDKSNNGVNWNAGPAKKYLVTGDGFFERLGALMQMVIDETGYNLYSITSAYELNDTYATIFGLSIGIACILGLYFLIKNPSTQNIFFLLLSASYIFTFMAFVFSGLLTYSPTRHFLYHLPFVLIWFGYGLIFVKKYLQVHYFLIALTMLFALYFGGSIYSFESFAEKRKDVLSNNFFNEVVLSNPADFWLIGEHSLENKFMPALKDAKVYEIPKSDCSNSNLKLAPGSQDFTFIYYSKRGELQPTNQSIINYINNYVLSCNKFDSQAMQVDELIKIKDIFKKNSRTEVDLSDRTSNGANIIYLQLYQLKVKPSSRLCTTAC